MAKLFFGDANFQQNQLLNAVAQNAAADLSSPTAGQYYFNNVSNTIRYYDGTQWVELAAAVTDNLADTLTVGNTTGGNNIVMTSGDLITSSASSSQIELNGIGGAFELTSDSGGFAEGYVYGSSTQAYIGFGDGSIVFTSTNANLSFGSNAIATRISDDGVNVDTVFPANYKGLLTSDNSTLTGAARTIGVGGSNALFLNSGSSGANTTFNQSVDNSVAVGGVGLTVKTNNTAYSNQMSFQQSGNAFDIIVAPSAATADRTQTLQDASGTLALTSDIIPVTIAADGSQNYLSVSNNEISVKNLLITDVTVDATHATIAAYVAANYTVGNEHQEGDIVMLTTATTEDERTWIHNGGTAVTVADFTRVTSTLDTATVRGFFSGGAGIAYNSGTGEFSITDDNKGVQVNADSLEVDGAEIAGNGLVQASNSWQIETDGSTIAGVGLVQGGNAYDIDIDVASNAEAEAQTSTEKVITPSALINFGIQQTFDITGDDTTTDFVLSHNLNNQWVLVQVYQAASPFAQVIIDTELTTVNTTTIKFAVAPATGTDYKVVIIGS